MNVYPLRLRRSSGGLRLVDYLPCYNMYYLETMDFMRKSLVILNVRPVDYSN